MANNADIGINKQEFEKFAAAYHAEWGGTLCAANIDGDIIFSCGTCDKCSRNTCFEARIKAISEGLRWGEPTLQEKPDGHLLWAVPLMHNSRLNGGVIACMVEDEVFPGDGEIKLDLRRACTALREMAERENFTNAQLLAENRSRHEREQKRAEAIHDIKSGTACNSLAQYLQEEPQLLAAIRRGDRGQAVSLLNRILLIIYTEGSQQLGLVKSLILELVVTMSRTAVEAGGEASELFGMNYQALAELYAIDSEEELSRWVSDTLNRIMDAISRQPVPPGDSQVQAGVDFIRNNYADAITRDDAANAAHMSGSHFSRLLKQKTGNSFTELLNQIRIDRASNLLRKTDLSLTHIALEVGFSDQSYFTRIFRKIMNCTPGEYRSKK